MLDPRLVAAFSRVFGIPAEQVTPSVSCDTLKAWDSVNHLKLILAVEKAFGIRFKTAEIPNLISAHRIQEALDRVAR